jgi:mRNA-degrading endonuclease toxin of MazEF toxin-antitoxin module
MNMRSPSANQLAALSALIPTPATKAKASITLSGNLLKVIDSLAGAAQRSATEVQVGVDAGLKHDSVINCDQITRLEKSMLTDYIGALSLAKLRQLRACW